MATHGGGGEYKDLVVFLAAAGVVVPLFNRLKISPVLGMGLALSSTAVVMPVPKIELPMRPWVSPI